MKEIKRYEALDIVGMYECENGDYIKHSDHLEAMALLEAQREIERGLLAGYMHSTSWTNIKVTYRGMDAKEALSTPITKDHLDALIEQRASEMFEPVAWWIHDNGSFYQPMPYELDEDELSRGWKQYPLYIEKAN